MEQFAIHRIKDSNFIVGECANKELFRVVDDISCSKKSASSILPNNLELSKLPVAFANFFEQKIIDIHARLQSTSSFNVEPISSQNSREH